MARASFFCLVRPILSLLLLLLSSLLLLLLVLVLVLVVAVVVVVVVGGGGVSHPSSGPIHVLHLVGCHYFALNIKIVNIV